MTVIESDHKHDDAADTIAQPPAYEEEEADQPDKAEPAAAEAPEAPAAEAQEEPGAALETKPEPEPQAEQAEMDTLPVAAAVTEEEEKEVVVDTHEFVEDDSNTFDINKEDYENSLKLWDAVRKNNLDEARAVLCACWARLVFLL